MWRGARRWAAALALGTVLAQPAWASPGASPKGRETASFSRFWEVAATWLAGGWQSVVAELTSDRGAMTDPNGATATANSDHGSSIDPDG